MTREHKLALIVSFSLILVLGVLISDHFSKASKNSPLAVELREPASPPFAHDPGAAGAVGPASTLKSTAPSPSEPESPRADHPPVEPQVQPPPEIQMAVRPGAGATPGEQPSPHPAQSAALSHMTEGPILTEPPVANAGLPPSSGTLRHHDVKDGDVMYDIARRYYSDGSLWTKLRDYNKGRVGENGALHGGVTLDIPPKDVLLGKARLTDPRQPETAKVAVQNPAKTDVKADSKSTALSSYVVQDGDTLNSIARKKLGNARRVQDIIDANKGVLDDPDDLKVGMSIHIPSR